MKTAVSIPDDVYRRVDRLARRTKRSRSGLFSEALAEYLARHENDAITEAMNAAVAQVGKATDPFVNAVAHRILERTDW